MGEIILEPFYFPIEYLAKKVCWYYNKYALKLYTKADIDLLLGKGT